MSEERGKGSKKANGDCFSLFRFSWTCQRKDSGYHGNPSSGKQSQQKTITIPSASVARSGRSYPARTGIYPWVDMARFGRLRTLHRCCSQPSGLVLLGLETHIGQDERA